VGAASGYHRRSLVSGTDPMAPNATIHKAQLQVSDMDRHYYASHALTLAQHPSETDQRVMVRLLAFALFADEQLAFGRGLGSDDEPDLWRRSLTGEIEQWIDLGQPDESRVRRACGRAREVVVVGYSGRGFELWWDKNAAGLARLENLTVLDVSAGAEKLAALLERNLDVQCLVQDAQVQWITAAGTVELAPLRRQVPRTRA
jgi:uncharacterized protein YaeQ